MTSGGRPFTDRFERALVRAARARRSASTLPRPGRRATPLGKEAYWMLVRGSRRSGRFRGLRPGLPPPSSSDAPPRSAARLTKLGRRRPDRAATHRPVRPGRACLLAATERRVREALAEAVSFRRAQLAKLLKEVVSPRTEGNLATLPGSPGRRSSTAEHSRSGAAARSVTAGGPSPSRRATSISRTARSWWC